MPSTASRRWPTGRGWPVPDPVEQAPSLVVAIDGFEGPLDLLLTLARRQKVDLRAISILDLAEAYLAFIAEARRLEIALAADYLVAAAWLAYLKSRLLLPGPETEEPEAEALAAQLARQLERLEAMRRAGARLMARDRLGRDIHPRGAAEPLTETARIVWRARLGDLVGAYARIRARDAYRPLQVDRSMIVTMEEALERLRGPLGVTLEWRALVTFLPRTTDPRSALASSFAAALELVRGGTVEMRQPAPFAPIQLRRATP